MITAKDISPCLVTRGNVDISPIIYDLETAGYQDIIIWDNSKRPVDLKVYGRYAAIQEAKNEWVYFQDDDVRFQLHDELIEFFNDEFSRPQRTDHFVDHYANDAHGPNRAGYDDLALSAAGAIVNRYAPAIAFSKYIMHYPVDHGFLYEADFIFGALTPFREIILPYTRLYADDDTRLCRQPWQEDLKFEYTNRARLVRENSGI